MGTVLWKNILREIRDSLGRFLAITGIIALGAAILMGLWVSRDAMVKTGDTYYSELNMHDFRLMSTLGWEQEDVDAFLDLPGLEAARGSLFTDALWQVGGREVVLMVHSITEDVNELSLIAGRMPEKPGECLLDAGVFDQSLLNQDILLSPGNDEDTLELLPLEQYRVVGLVNSPLYLNYERGTTSLGSGTVAGFCYLMEEAFDADYFTEIYLHLSEPGYLYSREYDESIVALEGRVEDLAEAQAQRRYADIRTEAQEEIDEGKQELADAEEEYRTERADAEQELADAKTELEEARHDLDWAWHEYREGWRALKDGERKGNAELSEAGKELDAAKVALDQQETEYDLKLKEASAGKTAYEQSLAGYESAYSAYEAAKAPLDAAGKQLEDAKDALDGQKKNLEKAEKFYDSAKDFLKKAESITDSVNGAGFSFGSPGDLVSALGSAVEGDALYTAAQDAIGGSVSGFMGDWKDTASELNSWLGKLGASSGSLNDSGLSSLKNAIGTEKAKNDAALDQWEKEYEAYKTNRAPLDAQGEELKKAKAQLDEVKKTLDEGDAGLAQWRAGLDQGWKDYNDGRAALSKGKAELEEQIRLGNEELADARHSLQDAEEEYADGVKEYEDGEAEAQEEFAKAEKEIADAKQELADAEQELRDLKAPTVHVLTRDDNIGYVCFDNDTSIVKAVSSVFPVFFFLVAALICMTTMTRMVDEQRTQIGTMKALGYGNAQIMAKYLIYSGSASILGCLLGLGLGCTLFPQVIWFAYGIMYQFAAIEFFFNWPLSIVIVVSYLACTSLATWSACKQELAVPPAALIRPKTGLSGKRILLERITPLWKRLSFMMKVSLRNVFRYKKRMLMMVLGIGGCTALLVTGFGLLDSVQDIVHFQYDEISLYDLTATFEDPLTPEDREKWENTLYPEGNSLFVAEQSVNISMNGQLKSAYLTAFDRDDLTGFWNLKNGDQPLSFPGEGEALINTKLSEVFALEAGDSFTIRDNDMNELTLIVSGVFDNYLNNYIILSADTCRTQWGREPDFKSAYVALPEGADPYGAAADLLRTDEIINVMVHQDTRDQMSATMQSLNAIVALVIGCAGALAFIVLYNLTNINITERIREIATIQVLGFYQMEAAIYVFRENLMLTAAGAGVGLGLGVLLHRFVMAKIQVDMVCFPIRIDGISFAWSVVLTFVFALIVDFFMYFRLGRIHMAEALKSVE